MTGMTLCARLLIDRMERKLGRRKREYQPTAAGIDGSKSQDVTTECAIGLGLLAVEKNMRAGNHGEEFSRRGDSFLQLLGSKSGSCALAFGRVDMILYWLR